jgi:hypothetical protein
MAKVKVKPADPVELNKPKRTVIRAKDSSQWDELLTVAKAKAWRRLEVTIQIKDKLLAGKPSLLDAASAMLKARGLDKFVATAETITDPTELAELADRVSKDEGKCEFNRRDGHPGVWVPSNNFKAGLKENWSVLGLRVSVRGSRGALAEGMFVVGPDDDDWIKVGDAPDGIHEAIAHTTGPTGPISSIKRHEYVLRPKLVFIIMMATADSVSEKISDDELAAVLRHWEQHGTGACRSQGFGKFDVVRVRELERC